jgi:excisionase family DNA binding protein
MTTVIEAGLLKPAEVCKLLAVSRTWVYAAAAEGRTPAVRLGGPEGPLRFVRADVERWLQDARAEWTPGRSQSGRAA